VKVQMAEALGGPEAIVNLFMDHPNPPPPSRAQGPGSLQDPRPGARVQGTGSLQDPRPGEAQKVAQRMIRFRSGVDPSSRYIEVTAR